MIDPRKLRLMYEGREISTHLVNAKADRHHEPVWRPDATISEHVAGPMRMTVEFIIDERMLVREHTLSGEYHPSLRGIWAELRDAATPAQRDEWFRKYVLLCGVKSVLHKDAIDRPSIKESERRKCMGQLGSFVQVTQRVGEPTGDPFSIETIYETAVINLKAAGIKVHSEADEREREHFLKELSKTNPEPTTKKKGILDAIQDL